MQNELYHWGIKGQRWGVRRYQNPDGTLTAAGKERYGASYNTMKEVRAAQRSERRMDKALQTGKVRKLSNDELFKVSQRLNMELNYKRAMEQVRPKHKSRALTVMSDIAENAAKDLSRRAFTKLGDAIFNRKKDTYSEYTINELDRLTDQQLSDYAARQKLKSDIIKAQYGKDTSISKAREKQTEAAERDAARVKEQKDAREVAKEASRTAKQLERELTADRRAEQKAQRARERSEESEMRYRMKTARYDEWMRDDYSSAFNFSSKSSAKKQTEKYADLKVDQIFNSEDDYYDWKFGSGRKGTDVARWSDIDEDILAHHGIKGQKWGVMNGPPYPLDKSDYTKAEKENKDLKKDDSKGLRSDRLSKGFTLSKGTTIYRTTAGQTEDLGGHKYVSFLESDRDHYKAGWIRNTGNTGKAYEHTYTLVEDLKVPSRKEVSEVMNQIARRDEKTIKDTVKAWLDVTMPEGSMARHYASINETADGYDKKKWQKFVNDCVEQYKDMPADHAWFYAAQSLGLNHKVRKDVIAELKNRGYNAMIDEASVGGQNGWAAEGAAPLIAFDGKSSLVERSSKEVSSKDEKKAQKRYNKWRSKAYHNRQKGSNW